MNTGKETLTGVVALIALSILTPTSAHAQSEMLDEQQMSLDATEEPLHTNAEQYLLSAFDQDDESFDRCIVDFAEPSVEDDETRYALCEQQIFADVDVTDDLHDDAFVLDEPVDPDALILEESIFEDTFDAFIPEEPVITFDDGEAQSGLITTVPTSCTDKKMDAEYARILAMFQTYAKSLNGFHGDIDLTQELLRQFLQLSPKIDCWQSGIAWRLTVYRKGLFGGCSNNFMRNAFMVRPLTIQFGHEVQVMDPFTLHNSNNHPSKVETRGKFISAGHCGGTEPGATSVSAAQEAARAQQCINTLAFDAECQLIYAYLAAEYNGLTSGARPFPE